MSAKVQMTTTCEEDAIAMAEQDLIDAAWNYIDLFRAGADEITLTKTNDGIIKIALAKIVRTPSDQLTAGVGRVG